jgi:hypothetical protein
MKMKSGAFLIVASIVICLIATLPMIINQDDSLMLPGLLLGGVLFLAGMVSFFRRGLTREDKGRMPHARKDA